MDTTYAARLLALGVAVDAGVPTILWGPPGIGKTAVVSQLAAHRGLHLETVIVSLRDQTDFAGLPVVAADGSVRLAPPAWARAVHAAGGGIVFLDELSTAAPSVQAACLRPLTERVVGELQLPERTVFLAAANPPDSAADGWDLSPPMANRLLHLEWSVPAGVVAEGFGFGWAPVPRVVGNAARVAERSAAVRALVAGFFRARPDLVHAFPDSAHRQGQAWPSPRSWDTAVRLLAHHAAVTSEGADGFGADVADLARTLLLTGTVGSGAALEFLAWERALDLPTTEEVLADPRGWKVPETADKAYAVLSAVLAVVLASSKTAPTDLARWVAASDAIARTVDGGHADVAVHAARQLLQQAPRGFALSDYAAERYPRFLGLVGLMRAA